LTLISSFTTYRAHVRDLDRRLRNRRPLRRGQIPGRRWNLHSRGRAVTPSARRTVWLALACAALADALLAPFYPQFFAEAFGAGALLTPGLYIALCRIAVGVALPIWTRWTNRVAPLRLVAIAQGLAGTTGLLCAFAPDLTSFLILSFVTESTRAAYLLLYPVLVSDAAPEQRSHVVIRGAALLHAAALLSALVGGVLLSTLGGRAALLLAALMDFAQLALLFRLARRPGSGQKSPAAALLEPDGDAAHRAGDAAAPPADAASRPGSAAPISLAALLVIGFLTTFAYVLLRPYFTLFLQREIIPGAPLWLLGSIFVLPSAVAVLARSRCCRCPSSAAVSPGRTSSPGWSPRSRCSRSRPGARPPSPRWRR
jgi:MFS transporter, DHA1 family, multidrug resistance protein